MNQDQDTAMRLLEKKHIKYMKEALKEAKKAFDKDEVPVGAIVVHNDKIIARAHNLREQKQQVHAHAEFLAIEKATKKIGSWRLNECDVYVTMEPCPMCAGAMIQSRVRKCYYGTKDLKSGVAHSIINLFELPFNHKVNIQGGILEEESRILLKEFFKKLR